MTPFLQALGGRKFIAFGAVLVAVYARAFGLDVDIETVLQASLVYVGVEGAADLVSRIRG